MKIEIVKETKPLLIDRHLPTQSEIQHRMKLNYGSGYRLVETVINPCAEEAERILYDLLTSSVVNAPVMITAVRHRGSRHINRKRKGGYVCPSCTYPAIKTTANYCPGCGKRIEWL